MFGKLSFNYNISFIYDAINKEGGNFVFESDSSIVFKKRGSCLVQFLYLGRYAGINIEHVDGDKIMRLDIDTKTGETLMHAYDAETDIETEGKLSSRDRDDILKKANLLYERRVKN